MHKNLLGSNATILPRFLCHWSVQDGFTTTGSNTGLSLLSPLSLLKIYAPQTLPFLLCLDISHAGPSLVNVGPLGPFWAILKLEMVRGGDWQGKNIYIPYMEFKDWMDRTRILYFSSSYFQETTIDCTQYSALSPFSVLCITQPSSIDCMKGTWS